MSDLSASTERTLTAIQQDVIACRACPRLVSWREQVARERRASFADQEYWGRAVPGFGDPRARILIVGLAPAAHGANRTGRMFTGDRSGDWLYRALHRAGLASQPQSTDRNDGLEMHNAYISAIVRCAPPENKPTTTERDTCLPFLTAEMAVLPARVVVCLGAFAWNGVLRVLRDAGNSIPSPRPSFGHGAEVGIGDYTVLGSFHPSQQNTFTGRLTEPMLDDVMRRAVACAS